MLYAWACKNELFLHVLKRSHDIQNNMTINDYRATSKIPGTLLTSLL